MNFSYPDMKRAIYLSMSVLGFFLLIVALILMHYGATAVAEPATFMLSAMILFIVGLLCVVFSMVTFLIRDDPDVWR